MEEEIIFVNLTHQLHNISGTSHKENHTFMISTKVKNTIFLKNHLIETLDTLSGWQT